MFLPFDFTAGSRDGGSTMTIHPPNAPAAALPAAAYAQTQPAQPATPPAPAQTPAPPAPPAPPSPETNAIQQAAMALDEGAVILNASISLDGRQGQSPDKSHQSDRQG